MNAVPRAALAAALGSALLWGGTAAPADAAPPTTSVLSGLITITATSASTLTTTGSTASGTLGPTSVVDARPGSTGYSVSVSTSGFDLVGATVSTTATHIPATDATVQVVSASGGTPSSGAVVALPSLLPIFTLSYSSAILLTPVASSYTTAITVTIPPAASQGRYSGTVTQTVV